MAALFLVSGLGGFGRLGFNAFSFLGFDNGLHAGQAFVELIADFFLHVEERAECPAHETVFTEHGGGLDKEPAAAGW